MKQLLFALLLFVAAKVSSQTDYYRQELQNLADISRLPLYRQGEIEQLSSYDRTGGNEDDFSGQYASSSIKEEAEGVVIGNLKGPGVINRIWTPTPETDTLKFYFDGEAIPRINLPFIGLFTGNNYPFVSPLCGNAIGGYYCYLPIPYEKSLKIVFKGKRMRFHQIQYRSLPESQKMRSFSAGMFGAYKDILEKIASVWSKQVSQFDSYGAKLRSKKISLNLHSGTPQDIIKFGKGARIVGIELSAGGDLLQACRKVMLTARWDKEADKALDLPLHDFFGFGFGKPAMQSLIIGSDQKKLYSYLPMPFDNSAELTLNYKRINANDPEELLISGTIYYTEDKRDKKNEGKLYAQTRRVFNGAPAVPHLISDVKGKGHFIGTILTAQGLEGGHTSFFEGDDIATIDGKMKLHGTGSEDYFNGGYYGVIDKWDKGMNLPIHGSIEYDQTTSRTGGYRFYLSDKLNFDKSITLTIEHQPDEKRNVKTDYTSVGFFYAEAPHFVNTKVLMKEQITKTPRREKLTPQGMLLTLYWLATASFDDPAIVFSMKKSDAWYADVDMEAIPIVQLSLPKLDQGRYRLYVQYGNTKNGSPFSVWQRSKQVSDWIPTDIETSPIEGKTVVAGNIDITDDLKTITLRKKKIDEASIRIYSFYFEKIDILKYTE